MSYTPFYISSFEDDSGLFTYSEPFLAPDKAFPILENAYCWRGRIKRRQGFSLLGRLRRRLATVTLSTQANGAAYANADILADPSINVRAPAGAIAETNAQIQPGSVSITVGGVTFSDNGDGTLTGAPATNSGTINYATGALALTFVPALGGATNVVVTFAYYPSLPVMGLLTRERPDINNEQLIAFDRKYAYQFSAGQFVELASVAATTWNGTDSDFFWPENYWYSAAGSEIFWVTNFNRSATPDPIRYYDGTTWTTFNPAIDGAGNRLQQCRLIISYKGRLVTLNTWEGATLAGATQFPQRARWSQDGTPIDLVNGWLTNVVGRGGYLDAPTNEHIVSAQFVKDVLLVKFERSSWKLVFTGNYALPFVWQKINTELGAESTFSQVPFDDGVYTVGNYGITTDDSVSVKRIDQTIPQIVFSFNNDNNGVRRVYGIRDYSNELVYWTYPNSAENPTFPNRTLVYNYVNDTYAIFKDSFTCFGYFQEQVDRSWSAFTSTTWGSANFSWYSPATQSLYPEVCAGNQQGYVEILNQKVLNDVSLSISALNTGAVPNSITVINHNLQTGDFIKITGCLGNLVTNLNGHLFRVRRVDADNLQLFNAGTFTAVDLGAGATYLGGGQIAIISNINIWTKRFSPFYQAGSQCRLAYLDFFMEATAFGELTANIYVDENDSIPLNDPAFPTPGAPLNTGLMGNNVLLTRAENTAIIPFQTNQSKIWHRLFVQSICQNFQVQFTFSDAQMSSEQINDADVVLHAMVIYLSKNSRLVQ